MTYLAYYSKDQLQSLNILLEIPSSTHFLSLEGIEWSIWSSWFILILLLYLLLMEIPYK